MSLVIYNTLTREKESFAPLDPGHSDSVRLDLGPGNYVAYSPMPDRSRGFSPGYAQGIFVPFTRAA